ncbi:hypothetical protein CAPTEDRAFT_109348 [Capitella teleta]|uniref:C2H2-type domain-containing protein n=1 Tax=Capitella teleta TaxID=283909 RepID=R7U990_CAPTE|nr:hypothetical protein CAPTEDRAFT_109348 [Capitella teleta]|eukprot:ELU02534.1 hypothetical protein CAPTEDRAFT_109348 [Capitella teleta]
MSDDSDDKPLVPRNVSLDQPTGLIGIPQVGRPEDLRDDDDDDDENDTGERPYQCTECSYKARKKGQLRKHMAVHNVFQCAHCEYSAKARDELQEHMKEKHPNRCGRKLCKKCNVLFLAVDLEEHEKQCTGEKKGWTCPHCQKEFKFVCVMKTHIQRWHTEEGAKRFGCKQCDFRALCQKELSAHNHAEHREVEVKPARAIKCPECDEQFDDEASVRTHVKEMHIHERPFICELCQKAFKTKTHLKNHYETHNPSDTYKCEEEGCLSTFKAAKYYERHRVEVHKLPPRRHRTVYACSQEGCSEVFQRKSHLQRHEISHTG